MKDFLVDQEICHNNQIVIHGVSLSRKLSWIKQIERLATRLAHSRVRPLAQLLLNAPSGF